jgi:hypothetical protein
LDGEKQAPKRIRFGGQMSGIDEYMATVPNLERYDHWYVWGELANIPMIEKSAERAALQGRPQVVHFHRCRVPCVERCYVLEVRNVGKV